MPILMLLAAAVVFVLATKSAGPSWDTEAGQRHIDAVAEREVALAPNDAPEAIAVRVAQSLYPGKRWPPEEGDIPSIETWNKLLTVVMLIIAERSQR